ncbi:HpcH/HpaI aldolase/citrate lyase family protein [Afifella pfennigii]|uniref:HpcH/HpaI aldolase/citrate lyase family protein n=1 Tax=Afifella pfennigii TaxID=209897 RepID=UPI00047DC32B|nr:CoA ester lyase [Afifella pfennigii]
MPETSHPPRLSRSLLYVPADKERALAKAPTLVADGFILDLEDAVAPQAKEAAREHLRAALAGPSDKPRIVRINALGSEWGTEDLLAALAAKAQDILLPKVEGPQTLLALASALEEADALPRMRIWAMIETPMAILYLREIAALSGKLPLAGLVLGLNDLAKETGLDPSPDRSELVPWMVSAVAAARAYGLLAIDGVCNVLADEELLTGECRQARRLGFDGKSLIHPAQIDTANAAFAPAPEAIAEAEAIRAAFADPANAGKGALAVNGRMVERLHLATAERLLAQAALIAERERS